ncbi:Dabb family protein [Acetobacter cibinongensis]|uniref:Dabb family protein n=1 Tax=Acetobacter cibinongensis TaxID=146475 RepID=UPI0030B827C7
MMTYSKLLCSLTTVLACSASLAVACALPVKAAPAPTLGSAALAVQKDVAQVGEARFTAPDYKPGTVRHMVMFQFKPSATQAQRAEVTKRFMALAQLSRRPDGTSVIAALEAGPQNSGENADLGLDYGYLVSFKSAGDRNYYVGRPIVQKAGYFDPAHDAFKTFAGPYLQKVVVFDFPVTP